MGIRNRNRNKQADKPQAQKPEVKKPDNAQAVRDAHFFENGVDEKNRGGKAPKEA